MADEEIFFDAEGQQVARPAKVTTGEARDAKTRAKAAVSLKLAGATDSEIADTLGFVDAQAARRAYERELAAAYDPATDYEALRRVQAARHEALLKSLAPKALNATLRVDNPDKPGEKMTIPNDEHLNYAREFRATVAAIGVLHGLNAPQVLKIQTPDQKEFNQLIATVVRSRGALESNEGDIFAEDIVDAEVLDDGEGHENG